MTLSLSSSNVSAGAEESFWKWFEKNEGRLFEFEKQQEKIFNELSQQLHRVNEDLTFEFSPVRDRKREFVISAGGIKAAFPAVEALYNKAPVLPRWVWIKFRPRRVVLNDLTYDGKSIKVEDVHYLLARDGDKIGIILFFDGYNEKEKSTYGQIGFLLLDEALGEYVIETAVGFVEFHDRGSNHFGRALPLRELPAHFDKVMGRSALQ